MHHRRSSIPTQHISRIEQHNTRTEDSRNTHYRLKASKSLIHAFSESHVQSEGTPGNKFDSPSEL
jgi:hypothetical protein